MTRRQQPVPHRHPPAARTEPGRQHTGGTGPGQILGLQRSAGNQAVTGMLAAQRKKDPDAKPKAGLLSDNRSLTRDLESAVEKKDKPAITAAEAALFNADPGYFAQLMVYKVTKHRGDKDKTNLYTLQAPPGSGTSVFRLAWQRRNPAVVAYYAVSMWRSDQAECKNLALQDPAFFIDHFIIDGLRREQAGKLDLKAMIEGDKDFLSNLATADPIAYRRLTDAVPLLKLVAGVEADVDSDIKAGTQVSALEVVDRLFDAFVGNRAMELAYAGTAMDANELILTGMTEVDKKLRDAKNAIVTMPPLLSTACHQILGLFRSVLASYPGLEDLDVQSGDEPAAVLTQPLAGLPGGLIKRNYTGNVFDAAGRPTGQIFFSGNRANPANSHSWVVINGVAYDPVLGTRGNRVGAAMNGLFDFDNSPDRAVEKGSGRRVLTRAPDLHPSGEYDITTAWRLS